MKSPQPCGQSLNSELRLRLDARQATWWRRACDFNLASQKYPTLTQHRHRGGRGGGGGRAFNEQRRRRSWKRSVFGVFGATSPLLFCHCPPSQRSSMFLSSSFSRLTCDPFVRLAVTVVRVAGKVQRVQRADTARAICTEKEGHRRKDQYAP